MQSHGEDIEGVRFERIQVGSAFGYREMILIYEPRAAFTEWDEEFLLLTAKNLIASARARNAEANQ